MQWIIENWLLVLVGGALIGMHLFGHGHGHGGKKKWPRLRLTRRYKEV